MRFDIRPQALATALRAYSELTGLAILVDGDLTAGRRSPGVRGELAASDALRQLLQGTGLEVRYASSRAFTLTTIENVVPVPRAVNGDSVPATGRDEVMDRYAGVLQDALERALCRSRDTRPGDYRMALQLWIAPRGAVEKARMLDSDLGRARSARIIALLDKLVFDPPPASLPQPVTLLLLPRDPGMASVCRSAP